MRLLVFTILSLFTLSFVDGDSNKVNLKKVKGKYKYIPSGMVDTKEGAKSVNGFFMMTTEVSNEDYREFQAYLQHVGDEDKYRKCKPSDFGSEVMKTYLNHPAYSDFPVTGISKEAAQAYCEWLGSRLAINKTLGKNVTRVEMRLPEEAEWIHAAKGGRKDAIYPWGGYYLRNAKGKYLANFHRIDETKIRYNSQNGQYESTEPIKLPEFNYTNIKSGFENDFGLYNMSGNVAEMVADRDIAKGGSFRSTGNEIRIQSEMNFVSPTIDVGFRPVFTVSFE